MKNSQNINENIGGGGEAWLMFTFLFNEIVFQTVLQGNITNVWQGKKGIAKISKQSLFMLFLKTISPDDKQTFCLAHYFPFCTSEVSFYLAWALVSDIHL